MSEREPTAEHEKPVLWRWQYVLPLLTAVMVASATFFVLLNQEDSPKDAGPSQGVSDAEADAGIPEQGATPASRPPSPNSTSVTDDLKGQQPVLHSSEDCRNPTSGSGSQWQLRSVVVSTRQYETSYTCNLFRGGVGTLDFVLGSAYRKLYVTVGFADDSTSQGHEVEFEVIGDQRTYLVDPLVLRFGDPAVSLEVDVIEVSRLQLKVTEKSREGGSDAPSSPVWANIFVM